MNIQRLYEALTSNLTPTHTQKLSIYDLQTIYSHLATLPLREDTNGYNTTRLLTLLNVSPSSVTKSLPNALEFKGTTVIEGLRLTLQGIIEVCNSPQAIEGFAYVEKWLPLTELLAFIHMQNEYVPSKWLNIQGAAYENPQCSAACPFVLLAFKQYKGVPYSAWDRGNTHMGLLLPKGLEGLLELEPNTKLSSKDIRSIVETMFYTNKQKMAVKPDGYTMLSLKTAIPRAVDLGLRAEAQNLTEAEELIINTKANLQRMLLQMWVFNAKYRSSDLILDPVDWDGVPEDVWEGFIGFTSLGEYRATNSNLLFGKGEL